MKENFTYKARLIYQGTNYKGWQSQKDGLAVQDFLQRTFLKVFNKDLNVYGASRTDSGVHSAGQIIKFFFDLKLDEKFLKKILNQNLPSDIFITDICKVDESFSPRHDAKKKLYQYNFSFEKPNLIMNPFFFHYFYSCDLNIVEKVIKIFEGTHDFASFCTKPEGSTIRTIYKTKLIKNDFGFSIKIEGKSFLRYMVRRLVGAALTAGTKKYSIEYVKEMMEKKDPYNHLYNVPAKGLCLNYVSYDEEEEIINIDFFKKIEDLNR